MTKFLKRWVFLVLLLFLAVFFTGVAGRSGIAILFIVGIGFEGAFWWFFTRKKRKEDKKP